MALQVKICGITTPDAAAAAIEGGAFALGFIFFPRSPRYVAPESAAALARPMPRSILRVAVSVDATDDTLAAIIRALEPDLLQLHGSESPQRAAAIKARFGRPLMKAISVSDAADLAAAESYLGIVEWLLFDAKPPKTPEALPGGNALAFDWTLLAGRTWPCPWMLSGGLTSENLAAAVRISGARTIDVSSGVEDRPGLKNPAKIAAFLAAARRL
ncbi:MAG: phosphoribosylanthranilate isomerase [Alphaproteobacteria bacterium]